MRDDNAILDNIRLLMNAGELPVGAITDQRPSVGPEQQTCDLCNESIPPRTAVEIEFWITVAVNVHPACAKIYRSELSRRGYW